MPHCQSRIEHDNHTPIHGVESPVLMRRETAVTDCDGIPKVASEIALCLTVYNEPA